MPTYTNNTTKHLTLLNTLWEKIVVHIGESIETFKFYYVDGLDKTDDLPLFNKTTASKSITLGSVADYLLHPDTTSLIITDITNEVDVRVQDDWPTLIPIQSGADTVRIVIERSQLLFEKLRISGTGTCTITEYRNWPWEISDGD
jgi:hypothetical protein